MRHHNMAKNAHNKAYRLGPFSAVGGGVILDGRTREGRQMRHLIEALSKALGGDPSPQQQLIIRAVAVDAVKAEMLVPHVLADDNPESGRVKQYVRLSGAMTKKLVALGLERKAAAIPDLKSYIEGTKA